MREPSTSSGHPTLRLGVLAPWRLLRLGVDQGLGDGTPLAASTGMRRTILGGLMVLHAAGCRSVYYEAMDAAGYEQEEILRSRLHRAHETQLASEAGLKRALSSLEDGRALSWEEVGALESDLEALGRDIESVEDAAQVTFQEQEKELEEIEEPKRRRASAARMEEARRSYGALEAQLLDVEARFEELLELLRQGTARMGEARDAVSSLVDRLEHTSEETRAFVGEERAEARSLERRTEMLATAVRWSHIR